MFIACKLKFEFQFTRQIRIIFLAEVEKGHSNEGQSTLMNWDQTNDLETPDCRCLGMFLSHKNVDAESILATQMLQAVASSNKCCILTIDCAT
jgi:hypothetical protein